MKKLVFISLVLLLVGCNNKTEELTELEKVMKQNEYIIVDVRTKREYNGGHLVGAINIPYDEINEETNLDSDKLILVYCKSGSRSAIAYDTLISLGYDVYNMGAFDEIDLPKE